jgi:hypothetical protein
LTLPVLRRIVGTQNIGARNALSVAREKLTETIEIPHGRTLLQRRNDHARQHEQVMSTNKEKDLAELRRQILHLLGLDQTW